MENELSCKRSTAYHPPLNFNNIPVAQMNSQKHLGMQLEKKLNFEEHLNKIESKVNKTISIIRKLQNVVPRTTLLTIYKSFIKPHLDYGDIIYDTNLMSLFMLNWNHFNIMPHSP